MSPEFCVLCNLNNDYGRALSDRLIALRRPGVANCNQCNRFECMAIGLFFQKEAGINPTYLIEFLEDWQVRQVEAKMKWAAKYIDHVRGREDCLGILNVALSGMNLF